MLQSVLPEESRIRRQGNVIDAVLDGEVIVLCIEQDAVFGLGPVGSRIWELIDGGIDFGALCDTLTREFDVEPDECRRQTHDFLMELRQSGLMD